MLAFSPSLPARSRPASPWARSSAHDDGALFRAPQTTAITQGRGGGLPVPAGRYDLPLLFVKRKARQRTVHPLDMLEEGGSSVFVNVDDGVGQEVVDGISRHETPVDTVVWVCWWGWWG